MQARARKQKKVVALGPARELLCLKSAGVEVVALEPGQGLEEELARQASSPEVGLILVSEPAAQGQQAAIDAVRRERAAVILVVPSFQGTADTTLAFMKRALEQSLGVDLISKE